MTPRYAVWQNAQQLPLFLQGERPQRKPWLAFFVGFWLAWLGSWLAFWLVWFGSWLAFWLVWFGSWLAFWLVWLGSWLVWFGFWLAFWLVWLGSLFFPCFFSSPCRNAAAGILQAYLGVIILQPHACTQRFRLRILRRTRSNAGRTSARSLSGRI